jgi:hypothetical protein
MSLDPIRQIGNAPINAAHRASCHCGGVVLELDLHEGLVDVHRCSCSMCRRKGAIMGAVPLERLRVVQGADLLTLYQFNTMTAKHYFCSRCGIYTHHRRRSKPNQYGFNIGCLEGIQPTDIPAVPTFDGVHHPSDTQHPTKRSERS